MQKCLHGKIRLEEGDKDHRATITYGLLMIERGGDAEQLRKPPPLRREGTIDESRDGREDQIRSWGSRLRGHCRDDYRVWMGWLGNRRHQPEGQRYGGLGESGGDLRRPIHQGAEQSGEAKRICGDRQL